MPSIWPLASTCGRSLSRSDKQRPPRAEPLDRQPVGQLKVRHPERAGTGRVGLRLERLVRHAQIGRAGAGDHPRDHHVRRQVGIQVAELLGDDRAAAGMDVLVGVAARVIAGEANLVAGRVARVVVVQAADDRPLVHDACAHRQHVGELNARHARVHRAELAAVLGRGVGLGVPHVDVAGPAAHPEQDDVVGLLRAARPASALAGAAAASDRSNCESDRPAVPSTPACTNPRRLVRVDARNSWQVRRRLSGSDISTATEEGSWRRGERGGGRQANPCVAIYTSPSVRSSSVFLSL